MHVSDHYVATTIGDYYARLITGLAGVRDPGIRAAFSLVRREDFCGPGPWPISTLDGYITTPSNDPIFLYSNVAVGLLAERSLNNGEPTFHARCLNAVDIRSGDHVVHVGPGAGYYTAVMAELTGPHGKLDAIEVDQALAGRAADNLAPWPWVEVHNRSGLESPFPRADVIYVNAGVSQPMDVWLDALKPGGRLILPLTAGWWGTVLLLTVRSDGAFDVRFVCPTAMIPSVGGQDPDAARRLSEAYGLALVGETLVSAPNIPILRRLRRHSTPDDTCWLAGQTWWFSTTPAP